MLEWAYGGGSVGPVGEQAWSLVEGKGKKAIYCTFGMYLIYFIELVPISFHLQHANLRIKLKIWLSLSMHNSITIQRANVVLIFT